MLSSYSAVATKSFSLSSIEASLRSLATSAAASFSCSACASTETSSFVPALKPASLTATFFARSVRLPPVFGAGDDVAASSASFSRRSISFFAFSTF